MKLNKQQKQAISVLAIFVILFSVLYFAIPFPKRAASHVAYVFAMLSFLVSAGILWYAYKDAKTLQSQVYGFPIFRVAMLYLALQVGVSVILFVIASLLAVPAWVSLVLGILLLAAALIGTIATDFTRDVIEKVEQETVVATAGHAMFHLNVNSAIPLAKTPAVRKALEKTAEKVRFSDPVSSPTLEPVEQKLTEQLNTLKTALLEKEEAELLTDIAMLDAAIDDRNALCKATKQRG